LRRVGETLAAVVILGGKQVPRFARNGNIKARKKAAARAKAEAAARAKAEAKAKAKAKAEAAARARARAESPGFLRGLRFAAC
jgi:Sec-independent protein translocase protein TatA